MARTQLKKKLAGLNELELEKFGLEDTPSQEDQGNANNPRKDFYP